MRHAQGCLWGSVRSCLLVGLLCLGLRAEAGTSVSINLPVGRKPPVNGLSLAVDCDWIEQPGYRPVKIAVTCTPPSSTDRTLSIDLTAKSWPYVTKCITVSETIEIPAGTSTTTAVVTMPQYVPWQSLTVDVWEDGSHLDGLSVEDVAFTGSAMSLGVYNVDFPAVLFVDAGTLDLTQFDFLWDGNQFARPGRAVSATNTVAQYPTFAARPASELVENWINYNSLDVICLSLSDVKDLAANRPRVWQAVSQWTWAGGNLCVWGVGDDWNGLPDLEQMLHCPATEKEAAQLYRGWRAPATEVYEVAMQMGNGGALPLTVPSVPDDPNAPPTAPTKPTPPAIAPFVIKPAMLGQVVAIARADPFPGKKAEWRWIFNTISPARWKWRFRHGLSLGDANPSFDNFLIADIGLPPIKSYRVLITLFVLAIGPLNYWILRRSGRLHLLLFTVPAAAFLATVGLIGYVVAADGFESRLRARSFTLLDQRNQQAVCWSRLSYYTGLAPSRGLTFPRDTVLLPFDKSSASESWGRGKYRLLDWVPDQHLTRGWLASRTPTQYVTVRAKGSRLELTITENRDTNRCTVENRLETQIKGLLLADTAGKLHLGQELKPGQKLVLRPVETDEATNEALGDLLSLLSRDVPRLPTQSRDGSTNFFFGNRIARRASYRMAGDEAGTDSSLLEIGIVAARRAIDERSMKPRTYLAIVERPKDIVVGMDDLIETESLHVISGKW